MRTLESLKPLGTHLNISNMQIQDHTSVSFSEAQTSLFEMEYSKLSFPLLRVWAFCSLFHLCRMPSASLLHLLFLENSSNPSSSNFTHFLSFVYMIIQFFFMIQYFCRFYSIQSYYKILTLFSVLYIIYFMPGSLYLLIPFTYFTCLSTSLFSDKHWFVLCICESVSVLFVNSFCF